jgi:uncharacterized protein (DUF4213/DUF364 family)
MWEIYDALIAAVPEDSVVKGCLAGLSWFLVRSEGVGVTMRPREGAELVPRAGKFVGMKTRELASWVKSWDMYEAALGLAAINSVLNAPANVRRNCGPLLNEGVDEDVFTTLLDRLRGKRVAVIGHFYNLERVAAVCNLSILERKQEPGDFPDPACEYILPEQEFVIMTATTLINKTMPRLLQLSRNARVVVAGPSTPLTPILLDRGVEMLGGLIVHDEERAWRTVGEGGRHELFESGARMVKVTRAAQAHSA